MTSAPTTWNVAWSTPGPDISGPNGFIIVGATTHFQLNNTIGGAFYVNTNVVYGSGFSFTGPSCASGNVTVTPATDPGLTLQIFAYEWDNNSTDYVHNTDYSPFRRKSTREDRWSPVQSGAWQAPHRKKAGWGTAPARPPGAIMRKSTRQRTTRRTRIRNTPGWSTYVLLAESRSAPISALFGAICVSLCDVVHFSGYAARLWNSGPDHCHQ